MTNREFYTAVSNGTVSAEVVAYAVTELAKLDNRNAKRRATPTKEQLANEPIKTAILAFLADNPKSLGASVAEGVGVTTQKVSALARQLATEGLVTIGETKIKGKGTLKVYSLTPPSDEVSD